MVSIKIFKNITIYIFILSIELSACNSKTYNINSDFIDVGIASWYGPGFNGRLTANGECFDMQKKTAAHPYLAFGTLLKVTNLKNKKQVVVRINDRGPAIKDRIIDLSKAAAIEIKIIKSGICKVKLEIIGYNKINLNTFVKHYQNLMLIKIKNKKNE